MPKLTWENQGYWDRLQRAQSWVHRAKHLQEHERDDYHGAFIFYWIAMNALYGRHQDLQQGEERDIAWFLGRICELDHEERAIWRVLTSHKRKSDRLLKDKFLFNWYWVDGDSANVKRKLDEEFAEAQAAFHRGHLEGYLKVLFRRLRVLRNQIFHGCSTDRHSLNKASLQPAVEILEDVIPQFLEVFENRGQRYDWPKIPYPRKGSPQHPS